MSKLSTTVPGARMWSDDNHCFKIFKSSREKSSVNFAPNPLKMPLSDRKNADNEDCEMLPSNLRPLLAQAIRRAVKRFCEN